MVALGGYGAYRVRSAVEGGALRTPIWSCLDVRDAGLKRGNGTLATADGLIARQVQKFMLPNRTSNIRWHATGASVHASLRLAYSAEKRIEMASAMAVNLPDCPPH